MSWDFTSYKYDSDCGKKSIGKIGKCVKCIEKRCRLKIEKKEYCDFAGGLLSDNYRDFNHDKILETVLKINSGGWNVKKEDC